ncbi:pre-mRNA-splicing factor CWC25 homolog isoform X5 [Agelaius tricolor]|uniref:pre-mRNA-splicing factor CWC25 homolog isoform X5 n=1 Tax=Agelaius tricolor TaxID=9191 RepID=UPI0039F1C698
MNGMKTPPRLGTEGHLHRFSLPPPPPVTHSGGRGAETRAAARGGDAFPVPNLKKSWHPQTLRNVEKVWKAEQKHEAERRKIEELQRELQEERAREEMQRYAEDMGTVRKREEKLEWMYQGPGGMVNRDEYLLGRPVDKFILDKVGDKDSAGDTGLLPGSIFARAGASSVLDMATKIREDPLFMISCRTVWIKRRGRGRRRRRKSTRSTGGAAPAAPAPALRRRGPELSLRRGWIIPSGRLLLPKSRDMAYRHSSREEKGRARSPSPKKSFRRQHPPGYTRKISPEELERKRQEMMENAKWREEERANNLRKHRKEEELEKELEKLDSRDGKFFHRLKLESASTSSLEDRVKRNIHSLQRTPAALEKNFMQR